MESRSTSPRRRHILSSINPESERSGRKRSASPGSDRPYTKTKIENEPEQYEAESRASRSTRHRDEERASRDERQRRRDRSRDRSVKREDGAEATEPGTDADDPLRPRSKRFRFKKPSSSRRERDREHDRERTSHTSHRRRRRRDRSPTPPDPFRPRALSPDAAFRESLFDAMADDEGAAYWEGVYGQPVAQYAAEAEAARGELEAMGEEEYASYVRRRMWEKTHEGLLEERARREEARRRAKEEKEASAREARRWDKVQREMEESLRRGEERRGRRAWRERWEAYGDGWRAWDAEAGERDAGRLPWPVESGRRADVRGDGEVRRFFERGMEVEGEGGAAARLREERVRWHPDKIQGKVRGGQVDKEVLGDVTAVFQVVDAMWNEARRDR